MAGKLSYDSKWKATLKFLYMSQALNDTQVTHLHDLEMSQSVKDRKPAKEWLESFSYDSKWKATLKFLYMDNAWKLPRLTC